MLIIRRGVRCFLVLNLALAATVLLAPRSTALADSAVDSTDRLCIPLAEMHALEHAASQNKATLVELTKAGKVLQVNRVGDEFQLRSGGSLAGEATLSAPIGSRACVIFPEKQVLRSGGSIKASYLEAFDAVTRFRKVQPWRIDAADDTSVDANAIIATYGKWVVVSLADNSIRRDIEGRETLSCAGVEYYRVNPFTGDVLPFDGCVENHTRLYPRFSQLPPQ